MQPPEQGSCLPLDRDAWCQNGGGSGSGWLWWVRRCWNSFHVVVKVWTSQGVMRSHSSRVCRGGLLRIVQVVVPGSNRSEEHTSELQSRGHLVCRLLLEKKKGMKCMERSM